MIKVSQRNYDLFAFVLEHKSYTLASEKFLITKPRCAQLCEKIGRSMRIDPYIKVLLTHTVTIMQIIKSHPQAIKEAFLRSVKVGDE